MQFLFGVHYSDRITNTKFKLRFTILSFGFSTLLNCLNPKLESYSNLVAPLKIGAHDKAQIDQFTREP